MSKPEREAEEVVDVRDVIAVRISDLCRPCRALAHLAQAHEEIPARAEIIAFGEAVEEMLRRYTVFIEADAKAAQEQMIEAVNEATRDAPIQIVVPGTMQ